MDGSELCSYSSIRGPWRRNCSRSCGSRRSFVVLHDIRFHPGGAVLLVFGWHRAGMMPITARLCHLHFLKIRFARLCGWDWLRTISLASAYYFVQWFGTGLTHNPNGASLVSSELLGSTPQKHKYFRRVQAYRGQIGSTRNSDCRPPGHGDWHRHASATGRLGTRLPGMERMSPPNSVMPTNHAILFPGARGGPDGTGLTRWRLAAAILPQCVLALPSSIAARKEVLRFLVCGTFGQLCVLFFQCCFSPRTVSHDFARGFASGRLSFTARFWVLSVVLLAFWVSVQP